MKEYLPSNLDIIKPILWDEKGLRLLDQRFLPKKEKYIRIRTWQGVRAAIKEMVVRGAPAIGITAAIGLVLGGEKIKARSKKEFLYKLDRIGEALKRARPTAVNLAWAIERMKKKIQNSSEKKRSELIEILRQEALNIWQEDIEANKKMGRYGASLLPEEGYILTHCNAGALATGGYGTALGVIRSAVEAGKNLKVFADETRPWLQGARLTAWEMQKVGIPVEIIPDVAAGFLMQRGEIKSVVVGADRIAANGDVANKIGTYTVAVLAQENSIPFYVAAPISTIDKTTPEGSYIPIEERSEKEVLFCGKTRIAPQGVKARNLAFDITPSSYIKAIITERGNIFPPYSQNIRKVLELSKSFTQ